MNMLLERVNFSLRGGVLAGDARVAIDAHELSMLLEGIEMAEVRTSERWEPPAHAHAG